MNELNLEHRLKELSNRLKSDLNADGFWSGQLSSSALAVAVALAALHFDDKIAHQKEIDSALNWLQLHVNSDGSFGDTPDSQGNISTSLLVYAALNLYASENENVKLLHQKVALYLKSQSIDVGSSQVASVILKHYKKDYTFSVPILCMCALCGIPQKEAFRHIPQLPFELALLPSSFYRFLNLSVVSYAIPALIAVGIVIFKKKTTSRFWRWIRKRSEKKAMQLLQRLVPESGGFLEAIPLTAFVVLSLIHAGYNNHEVVKKGIAFLVDSQRVNGDWPIDVDLSTWVTTLAIKSLRGQFFNVFSTQEKSVLVSHLKSVQNKNTHPFNGTKSGGWGWTNFSGSVPDCDDTPGAIIALLSLELPVKVKLEVMAGVQWLLQLQNKDGGFPTFSKGWGKLPFDRSCADLTGHCVLAISACLKLYQSELSKRERQKMESALYKAILYLRKHQHKSGYWIPLWFGNQLTKNHQNPVYGTARVLCYLHDAQVYSAENKKVKVLIERMIQSGLGYLINVQNNDGSWGGAAGVRGSIEETALAVSALVNSGFDKAIGNGMLWLDMYVQKNGMVASPIGLYFASLWYHEKLYPLTAYLEAVTRLMEKTGKK